MWFVIFCLACVAFWALNIYFRDDGTKLKHSPVIDEPLEPIDPQKAEAFSNKLIFLVSIALIGLFVFVFSAAS